MFVMTVWGYLPRRSGDQVWTSPNKKSVLQSAKLKAVGDVKNALTSDMKMQNLEFA